jgi:hypothetical protein
MVAVPSFFQILKASAGIKYRLPEEAMTCNCQRKSLDIGYIKNISIRQDKK